MAHELVAHAHAHSNRLNANDVKRRMEMFEHRHRAVSHVATDERNGGQTSRSGNVSKQNISHKFSPCLSSAGCSMLALSPSIMFCIHKQVLHIICVLLLLLYISTIFNFGSNYEAECGSKAKGKEEEKVMRYTSFGCVSSNFLLFFHSLSLSLGISKWCRVRIFTARAD